MRIPLLLGAVLLPWTVLPAAKKEPLTAAQILDEVVTRPGDFDQMCDAPPAVPYSAPPIPAYGLSVPQTLFPSDEMKDLLKAHRPGIIKEMAARFEKLDWLHPPPAPPVPKEALFLKKEPGNEEFDQTKPSGQNPKAVGGIMLTIVLDLDAVELLPQLLRLEDDLHKITQAALKDPNAPVPVIDIGGGAMWQGMMEEFQKLKDPDKVPPALEHKEQVFNALVFDRQMLGVMLQLLQHQNYAPLKESTPGLLRAMTLKKAPLDEEMAKIKGPQDIPENERRYVFFDKELGVPYWRYETANMLYSEALRTEVRGLAEAFINKTAPPVIKGADLLDEALSHPGGYSQMCLMPAPLPFDAPVPAYGILAPRNDFFDAVTSQNLQAHRQKVIPVLVEHLHDVDIPHSQVKNLNSLVLETVRLLNGIEALPELLRIEDQLHAALAAAQQDAGAPLPDLNLNSPVVWAKAKTGDSKPSARKDAEFKCRIMQREMLGLMAKLLRDEDFPSFFNTEIEKEHAAGLRKIASEGELKDIKTAQDIPYESRNLIVWDKKIGIPVYRSGGRINVPYTEALRDEVRRVAEDFLKNVPPSQWKGEAAMDLIGIPQ
jgi:hypothetical protein